MKSSITFGKQACNMFAQLHFESKAVPIGRPGVMMENMLITSVRSGIRLDVDIQMVWLSKRVASARMFALSC